MVIKNAGNEKCLDIYRILMWKFQAVQGLPHTHTHTRCHMSNFEHQNNPKTGQNKFLRSNGSSHLTQHAYSFQQVWAELKSFSLGLTQTKMKLIRMCHCVKLIMSMLFPFFTLNALKNAHLFFFSSSKPFSKYY